MWLINLFPLSVCGFNSSVALTVQGAYESWGWGMWRDAHRMSKGLSADESWLVSGCGGCGNVAPWVAIVVVVAVCRE
ncbi:hypothetical protein BS47DRAFT_765952 [Hydnum rufescens UP504]|uniref:Secreted protein n=1 Tax=Hydnum rufescens UP504 TaxID=1448309 RepID=A0A9P6BA64_9AGAM|nr:hypothetical protein BS47DRAFT_765952 [Hydnum rufescens UP504]